MKFKDGMDLRKNVTVVVSSLLAPGLSSLAQGSSKGSEEASGPYFTENSGYLSARLLATKCSPLCCKGRGLYE